MRLMCGRGRVALQMKYSYLFSQFLPPLLLLRYTNLDKYIPEWRKGSWSRSSIDLLRIEFLGAGAKNHYNHRSQRESSFLFSWLDLRLLTYSPRCSLREKESVVEIMGIGHGSICIRL